MSHRYFVNPAQVVHDEFEDGEIAVINLQTGTYFTLVGTASLLWPHLVDGSSAALLAELLERRTGVASGVALPAVTAFLAELAAEGLVEEDDGLPAALPPDGAGKVPYVEPHIERFDDLQELLLLDPVHEVTDAGWPHVRTDALG